ncbi:MAG: signal peptidase II [Thermoleophilia bacterium]
MRIGPESAVTRRRIILKWSLLAVALLFALALDLVTKSLAEHHLALGETHQITSFFSLQRTVNSGVAFGMLRGGGTLIIVANIIAILIVLFYVVLERRPFLGGISGGLIIGGSLGNLVQRLSAEGQVTDFIKLPHWPNFNMADVFLVVGIAAVLLGLIAETVRVWKAGRRETPAAH